MKLLSHIGRWDSLSAPYPHANICNASLATKAANELRFGNSQPHHGVGLPLARSV